jgi:hypothetical protein
MLGLLCGCGVFVTELESVRALQLGRLIVARAVEGAESD